jgi:DNA polymerase type B, organellar and viral
MEAKTRAEINRDYKASAKGRAAKAVYEKTEHGKASAKRRQKTLLDKQTAANRNKKIVAWDSEGADLPNGKHIMIYLANSEGKSISNASGIDTVTALDFLLSNSEPDALNVWFAGGYDVNMILKDIPREIIEKICRNKERYGVEWKGISIMYRSRKEFYIHEVTNEWVKHNKKAGDMKKKGRSIRIWDSFGYHQCSFLKAYEDWLGKDADYDLIVLGKKQRQSFNIDEDLAEYIPRYTAAELRGLVRIEERMRTALQFIDVHPLRHDGAGSVASALLTKHGIKHYKPDERKGENLPAHIIEISQHAYFGGRIECMQYGRHQGIVHHYDINSAYPAAMIDLPQLKDGEWVTINEHEPNTFSCYHVVWQQAGSLPFFPLPYRVQGGGVRFPGMGECWVWEPELAAALATEEVKVTIISGVKWEDAAPHIKPFKFIEELYDYRKELKEEDNQAQMVIKLGINSVYGKLAQRVGYDKENGYAPPYHCTPWAGYITSKTRATLYNAAYQEKDSIISFATDGIFSIAPLDLETNNLLGGWEYETHDEIISIQSGIYFYMNRKIIGGEEKEVWKKAYRGMNANALVLSPNGKEWLPYNAETVVKQWVAGKHEMITRSRSFIGMAAATVGLKNWENWGDWIEQDKALTIHPCTYNGKRGMHFLQSHLYKRSLKNNPAYGLIKTSCNTNLYWGEMSRASELPWLEKFDLQRFGEDEI